MTTKRGTGSKEQAFQKRCSGYAFACGVLFALLQFKSVEVSFGAAFFGVRLVVVSAGFILFFFSGMVGVSTFMSNKSKFRGTAMKLVNAFFPDSDPEKEEG